MTRYLRWGALALVTLATAQGCKRSSPQGDPGAAHAEDSHPFGEMTVQAVAAALAANEPIHIYDNNNRARYERGHVPGARYVGHDPVTAAVLPPDRNARLLFYCSNEH